MNRGQRPRAIEHGQLRGVAPIRFHSITRPTRNQGRRDDIARHALCDECPLELKAARPRFVTALHGPLAPQPLYKSQNRRRIGRERVKGGRPLTRQ
jgi:hypothetical protein